MLELFWSWRRQQCLGTGRSRRRLEDLVDVGVLEELKKADDAQVQEKSSGDWKTLLMSKPLKELKINYDVLEQMTYHQASHVILLFACCHSLHLGTPDVCLFGLTA